MSTDPPGLDLGRLRAHLDAQRPGLVAGELSADVVEGGRSNLTYVVGDGRSRWVVRRPPFGHVLPTAHDMIREFRVISGLRDTARAGARSDPALRGRGRRRRAVLRHELRRGHALPDRGRTRGTR